MRTFIKTTGTALLFLLAASCTKENLKNPSAQSAQTLSDDATQALHIGQSFGGGIIFYLDDTKQHGLIAAKQDQRTGIQWYNGMYVLTGATGKAIGTGARNTRKIVNAQGTAQNYAALVCSNYAGGGFTDWFLPSKNELNQLYKKRASVGGFEATNYWSSTEFDTNNAWDQEFGGGFQFTDDKSFTIHVRAIRAF